MKARTSTLFLLGAILMGITGCQKSENYQMTEASKNDVFSIYEKDAEELHKVSELQTLQDVYQSGYGFEEWQLPDIKAPGGILTLGDTYFVSDQEEDCILKVNHEGNVIAKTGQTGSGAGEFLSPSALTAYDGEIYVLDQGNNRIQVLDGNLSYLRELKLKDTKKEDPDYVPQSIAVNQEGVFVTGVSLENPRVDRYAEKTDEIAANFIGSISIYEEQAYFINSMARYYDKESDSFGVVSTAPEWLVSEKEGELEKVCELPYGFNITAFLIDEEGILSVSRSGGAVYCLNWDGTYEETIAYLPGLQDEETPQIAIDDQENIYVVMPKAKKIYRCYRQG